MSEFRKIPCVIHPDHRLAGPGVDQALINRERPHSRG